MSVQTKMSDNASAPDTLRMHYAMNGENLTVGGRITDIAEPAEGRHKSIFADGSELSYGAHYGRLIVECGKDSNVTVNSKGKIKYKVSDPRTV